jgi:SAM-dependent methyltransferase
MTERVRPRDGDTSDGRLLYTRHVFAYEEAVRRLSFRDSVLDIGCGEGYGAALLAAKVASVDGVDVHTSVVAHAARAYGAANCRFHVYDGSRLPFPTGTFDAVVSFQVVEHIVDADGFVEDAARVLRPGGHLILTTPNRTLRLAPGERPWNRYHVREYAAEELQALLARHFSRVEIEGVIGDSDVQAVEVARIAWARRMAARDPWRLRNLLPEGMKQWVIRLCRRDARRESVAWTSAQYHLTSRVLESLDLFAICVR